MDTVLDVAATAAGNASIASGAYTGMAPNANIINIRTLDSQGQGSESDTIAGVDWAIANKDVYNIKVLNMSLGATAVNSYME